MGTPELVSDDPRDWQVEDYLDGVVVVGLSGKVTAVWYRLGARGYLDGHLVASKRAVDGTWSDPVSLSQPLNMNASSFDVAAGAGDHVSVVWSARTDGRRRVYESHFAAVGWTSARVVGSGRQPQVAMFARGGASVAWIGQGIMIRSRAANGPWSAAHRYPGQAYYGAHIAANRAGDQVAMWNGRGSTIFGTARVAYRVGRSPRWPTAEGIRGRSFDEDGPGIAVAPGGSALAAWAITSGIGWIHRGPDTDWSPMQKLQKHAGLISDYGSLELVYNSRGEALALWQAENGSFASRFRPVTGFAVSMPLNGESSYFRAAGMPLLTTNGTAVVAGTNLVNDEDGYRVAYRWQEPGRAWSRIVRVSGTQGVRNGTATVGATGKRMAVFFANSSRWTTTQGQRGLYAIIIDHRT